MKVLHVIPSLATQYGGPSSALIGLSRALSVQGVSSEVVTTDLGVADVSGINYGHAMDVRGVKTRLFPRTLSSRLPRDYAFSPQLARWLKRHVGDYDIIHLHGMFNYPCTVAAYSSRSRGVPYVVRPCGMLDPWCLRNGWLRKRVYLKLFEDKTLRHAASVNFTTPEEHRISYKAKGQPEGVIIPLGVNIQEKAMDAAEKFHFPDNKKVILFLSRLDPKKGLDLLLPALARLREVRDDFLAIIAGSGRISYEAEIKNCIKLNGLEAIVRLVGFVEGAKKHDLLRQATCFVLPSYQENFGISVAEAMAAGCPVIISDQVNIHEDISSVGAGYVVPCDSGSIFLALSKLLDDESARRVMTQNGRKLVREKYSWDRIADAMISLYQECTGQTVSCT